MPVSVTSVTSVSPVALAQNTAAQGAATSLVLQPGTVVEAQVLNVLDASLVRIAIASLSIDVLTQVPLQAGAALKLAVSQTPDGSVRLAIVPPETPVSDLSSTAASVSPGAGQATDTSAIARGAAPTAPSQLPVLTPAQASAVNVAAQSAATTQSGLSPLFADVTAAVQNLPAPLQQVAAQLLAARTALTTGLDGGAIQSAFQSSGLFLESNLAAGTPQGGAAGGLPDLKAALLVFRQTLSTWLDDSSTPLTAQAVNPAPALAPTTDAVVHSQAPLAESVPLVPEPGTAEILPEAAPLVLAGEDQIPSSPGVAGTAAAPAASVLNLLSELEGAMAVGTETSSAMSGSSVMIQAQTTGNVPNGTDALPPPFRGAAPVAQPIALPTIVNGASQPEIARHLAGAADGAIARQTLLQVASLPAHNDGSSTGIDRTGPRWNFEIPFATPQGTAVAQFEISRDGGGKTVEKIDRIWRARFSLDVEPAGPVHAMVSLSGDTTSVRMWAERPQTTQKLRESAGDLSRALRQAELAPGDIVIGEGTPPQLAATAPPGHFLDRAT